LRELEKFACQGLYAPELVEHFRRHYSLLLSALQEHFGRI
jgi:hypothetical protein